MVLPPAWRVLSGVIDVMTNVPLAGCGPLAAPAGTGSKTASPAAASKAPSLLVIFVRMISPPRPAGPGLTSTHGPSLQITLLSARPAPPSIRALPGPRLPPPGQRPHGQHRRPLEHQRRPGHLVAARHRRQPRP